MSAETPDIEIKMEPGVEHSKSLVDIKNEPENYVTPTPEFVNIKMELNLPDISRVKEEPHSEDDTYIGEGRCNPSFTWLRPLKDSICSTVSCKEESGDRPNCKAPKIEVTIMPTEEQENSPELSDKEEAEENLNSTSKYCPVCHKSYANNKLLQWHLLMHDDEGLQCKICFREFTKIAHLKKHQHIHMEVKRYQCDQCDKKFKTTSNLQQHKRIHLVEKPFRCDVCHRSFAVRGNLVKHQGKKCCKRPIDEPIVCNICNKVFKKIFLLRSHLRRHTTERPYSCETCKTNFKYKSTLIRHVQLHNDNKPFSCKICKKNFTHAGLIKPHMRVHTGEKPYSCPVCNKLFSHKHNMQRHAQRHEKVKRLVCEICHKKFPKESRLRYHLRTHTKEKPFKCGICPKTFSHRQNVLRHYTRKHPHDTYNCSDTDASVARIVWENVINKKIKLEPCDDSGT